MSDKFRYSKYYRKKIAEKEALEKEKQVKELPVLHSDKEILDKIKKEIKEDYTNTIDFLAIPTHIKILKILFTIAIFLIVLFILYKNFISAEQFNYFYDIGSKGESYLSPSYRVSEAANFEEITYRNLTSGLVYFNVPIPRGAEKINVSVRFKDNFSESLLILGAKDQEDWHYQWHTFFSKVLENISSEIKPNSESNIQIYKIDSELKNENLIEIENSSGLIIASSIPINNTSNKINFSKEETQINNAIRGGHTFYVYTSGELELNVEKQDLNWYNGSDELTISLYDANGVKITNTTISDDGIKTVKQDKKIIDTQAGELFAENLSEGVYKLVFSDFDGIIRKVDINTNRIVVAGQVYLANSNIFFEDLGSPTALYTAFGRNASISFKTWHNQGFQTIAVNNQKVKISERINESVFNALPGNYSIKAEKNDVIVSTPGYFAFSRENYFEPFANRIIPFKNNYDWLNSDVDYIIVEYNPPVSENNSWITGEVSLNLNQLYIKDNKLSMVFNTPHLAKEQYKNYTIPLDWINITVYKPGLYLKK